jgi:hypothetical protein
VKLSEGSRASFRKPKDALFSKQVHQAARGEASFRNKFSILQKADRGEASFRKKKDALSVRSPKAARPPKDAGLLQKAGSSTDAARGEASRRTPPEVKLLSESRQR